LVSSISPNRHAEPDDRIAGCRDGDIADIGTIERREPCLRPTLPARASWTSTVLPSGSIAGRMLAGAVDSPAAIPYLSMIVTRASTTPASLRASCCWWPARSSHCATRVGLRLGAGHRVLLHAPRDQPLDDEQRHHADDSARSRHGSPGA